MRRMFRFALLFSGLAVANPLFAANRALLIGVGNYKPEIGPLPGIEKDMALANEFAGLIGFKPNEIKVLFNQNATLGNIKAAFNTWLKEAGPNDKVFIYFSGHGAQVPDTNGDEEDGLDELWVTYDTAINPQRHLINYLLDDEVDEMVSSLASKNVLIVLDSCHSGSAAKSLGDIVDKRVQLMGEPRKAAASRAVVVPRWVLLGAAQDNETAGASQVGSFLTTNLVAIAKQLKAAGKPFTLNATKEELTRSILRSKPDQHPNLDGSATLRDTNWFANTPGGPAPPPPPPPSGSAGFSGELADKLEAIYKQRVGDLKCALEGGAQLKSGATVKFTCNLPHAGFLYVFNLGGGDKEISVLLPNKWVQTAAVEAGPITLPSPQRNFTIRVKLPAGFSNQPVRLYALLTSNELKSVPENFSAGFGSVGPSAGRALEAEGPEGYEAARIEFVIVP